MIYKATESIGTANKNRGQREFSEIPSDCLPPKSTMHRRSTDTFIDKHDSVSEQKNKGSALDSSAAEVAPTTIALRFGGIAVFLLLAYFRTEGNQLLSVGWNYLKTQWWFRHDSLEPVVATLAFLPPLQFFYCIDMHSVTPAGAWLNKYRIRANGADMTSWKPYPVKELLRDPFKTRFMVLLAYIGPIMIIDRIYPRRALPDEAPTMARFVGEIALLLVMYDAFFFLVHRTLHAVPVLYRWVHKKHHMNTNATRANDTVRLTMVEEMLDVGCSVLAVNLSRAHPLSRVVYNTIIVYLLVELHCGYDMPWMIHNIVPHGLMGGPRRHDAHHAHGRHYFQKFFTYLDAIAGPLGGAKKAA